MQVNGSKDGKVDNLMRTDLASETEDLDGAIIVDTKRKRVDSIGGNSIIGSKAVNTFPVTDKSLPKNLLEVGPGSQAHLSQ